MSNYFKHKMRGKNPAAIAALIILGIVAISGLAILFGFIILWLWNWLMPELFGLPMINFWQGIGLFILAKILFGCMGGGRSGKKYKDDSACKDDKKNKSDFSRWKHYDRFWEEEGDKAYDNYLARIKGESSEDAEETQETTA